MPGIERLTFPGVLRRGGREFRYSGALFAEPPRAPAVGSERRALWRCDAGVTMERDTVGILPMKRVGRIACTRNRSASARAANPSSGKSLGVVVRSTGRLDSQNGDPLLRIELSVRGMLLVGFALLAVVALVQLWSVVVLLLTSLILMGALLPYVTWLETKGVPRVAASLLLVFVIVLMLFLLFAVTVPAVVDQFRSLAEDLPGHARRLDEALRALGMQVNLKGRLSEIDWARWVSGPAVNYGARAALWLFSLITVSVLTVYLLIDAPKLAGIIYAFVPHGREPDAERVLNSLSRVVGGYVRGQVITSVAIGVYTFLVLTVARIPDALAFAVLAGFMDIIPIVGAIAAVGPPVLAAFELSSTRALVVLAALLAYQQFEDRYLAPNVYGSTLKLPPLVVLLAATCGAQLLGIAGVLLALPAAAAARLAVEYWLEHRQARLAPDLPRSEALAPETSARGSVNE
jgi:putative heme transporter